MVLKILYKKDSPQERQAAGFLKELERHEVKAELIDGDSPEGAALTELYDLPGRPALVVAREDGQMLQRWQNDWPLVSEVSYYFHS
jgi:hypothetical protein